MLKDAAEFQFNRKRSIALSIGLFVGGICGFILFLGAFAMFMKGPEFRSIRELMRVIMPIGFYAAAILTSLAPVILWLGLLVRGISLSKDPLIVHRVESIRSWFSACKGRIEEIGLLRICSIMNVQYVF